MLESDNIFTEIIKEEGNRSEIEEKVNRIKNLITVLNLFKSKDIVRYLFLTRVKVFNSVSDFCAYFPVEQIFPDSVPLSSDYYYLIVEVNVNSAFQDRLFKLTSKLNVIIKNQKKSIVAKTINLKKTCALSSTSPIQVVIPVKEDPIDSSVEINLCTFIKENKPWVIINIDRHIIDVSYLFLIVDHPIENQQSARRLLQSTSENGTLPKYPIESFRSEIVLNKRQDIKQLYNILLKNCAHQCRFTTLNKFVTSDLHLVSIENISVGKYNQAKLIFDLDKYLLTITGESNPVIQQIRDYFQQEIN